MKTREIAENYELDEQEFIAFLKQTHRDYHEKFNAIEVRDGYVEEYVAAFRDSQKEENAKFAAAEAAQKAAEKEAEAAQKAAEDEKNREIDAIPLSTCPDIPGAVIEAQYGIVFGEVAFKTSLFKAISSYVKDLGDALSFGQEKEMSGSANLLADARNYALRKMRAEAYEKGANAIIGVDFESSVGGEIMHVTVYGTAVLIKPIG